MTGLLFSNGPLRLLPPALSLFINDKLDGASAVPTDLDHSLEE
jgi:hypothetical protein